MSKQNWDQKHTSVKAVELVVEKEIGGNNEEESQSRELRRQKRVDYSTSRGYKKAVWQKTIRTKGKGYLKGVLLQDVFWAKPDGYFFGTGLL